jgi:LysM repeat protein
MRSHRLVLAAAIAAVSLAATTAQVEAQSGCGPSVTVARGDTLSEIAERCDVSELAILRANSGITGSADLQVGMELKIRDGAAGFSLDRAAGRLKSFAQEAGDTLEDLAAKVGSSVEDLLNSNPDLHQRLRQLGDRLSIPGVDASKAQISLEPPSGPPGTAVTISAVGLPANAPVTIGGGAPRAAYEILDRAWTSNDGTLQATVRVPEWAADTRRFVFAIANADGTLKARSPAFQIAGVRTSPTSVR